MRRLVRCSGLWFLALALLVPASLGQEKENPAKKEGDGKKDVGKKKDDPAEKGKKEKFTWGHEFTAKLTKLETGAATKEFTVQVSQKITEINPDVQRQLAQHQATLAQQQDRLRRARNANERQQIQQQINQTLQSIQQSQRNLYRTKDVNKDYQLRPAEDMKVRTFYPPPDYDDKGNLKKYTEKELKALKGPLNLPGYTAEFDALRTGQMVRVYLARVQPPPGKGAPVKGKKIGDEDELGMRNLPEAVMIVILGDAPQK